MSQETALRTFLEGDYAFFEGPRWHDGRLWLSDFYTYQVLAVTEAGQVEKVLDVPGQPSGLGWLPDGRLLVVSMRDRRILRVEDGRAVEHADLSALAPSHLNDMVVDADGRAFVSGFGSDILRGEPITPSSLIRVDPDGSAAVVADDLHFPNGMVILDGDRLVVAETFGNRLTEFRIAADGSLGDRRPFAVFGERPPAGLPLPDTLGRVAYAPDGMSGDAEGGVWFADAGGQRAVRVHDGEVVDEVGTAELGLGTFALTLGGSAGNTLFLCSGPYFGEEECHAHHEARVLTIEVAVPHAGLP